MLKTLLKSYVMQDQFFFAGFIIFLTYTKNFVRIATFFNECINIPGWFSIKKHWATCEGTNILNTQDETGRKALTFWILSRNKIPIVCILKILILTEFFDNCREITKLAFNRIKIYKMELSFFREVYSTKVPFQIWSIGKILNKKNNMPANYTHMSFPFCDFY